MSLKKIGKAFLCGLLERQVKQLRRRQTFRVVAVAGSIGKTSTKLAIAKTLEHSQKVIYQDGNYNDRLTVPLTLFSQTEPAIFNVFAWARILLATQLALRKAYPYDIAVMELGTDAPGQLKDFAYLRPDIAVVTAVSAEHMEFFRTLDAVAAEEMSVATFSKQVLANSDDIPAVYLPTTIFTSYSLRRPADYQLQERQTLGLKGQILKFGLPDGQSLFVTTSFLGEQGAKSALAAVAAAHMLGVSPDDISDGLQHVRPVAGRMQILPGIEQSTLIDDTYNASPLAVKAALDVLYAADAPQRIALLGSMNEMGTDSPGMHKDIGNYCDPAKLDMVVTIGKEANQYLAPAAKQRGCTVMSFDHPKLAGDYVKTHLKTGAVVLAKGSQNGVFAEEALVPILADPGDTKKLVRQSASWRRQKAASLPRLQTPKIA